MDFHPTMFRKGDYMDFRLIKSVVKTKFFKVILILLGVYAVGFALYLFIIDPFVTGIFRDAVHTIYWRWYLDWSAIGGFCIVFITLGLGFRWLRRYVKKEIIATFILPIVVLAANYFGMLALDMAVTKFADTGFNETWINTEITWLGMTSQQIYHGFFFWFMPALLITGIPLMQIVLLDNQRWLNAFKSFLFMMGVYELSLGYLDAIVCQVLWNDWSIYGTWSMMGTGGISAVGWMIHYTLNAMFLWFGIIAVELMYRQMVRTSL